MITACPSSTLARKSRLLFSFSNQSYDNSPPLSTVYSRIRVKSKASPSMLKARDSGLEYVTSKAAALVLATSVAGSVRFAYGTIKGRGRVHPWMIFSSLLLHLHVLQYLPPLPRLHGTLLSVFSDPLNRYNMLE